MKGRLFSICFVGTFLVGIALSCDYIEKQSPCCDDGVAEKEDVYLFTYYQWKGVYIYHTGIRAYGHYYFYNSGDNIDSSIVGRRKRDITSLIPWKEGIVTQRSSCRYDPNDGSYTFWKRQFLGNTAKTEEELLAIVEQMEAESKWHRYHVLYNNCNYFTREVASRLGLINQYNTKIDFKFPGFSFAR